MNGLKTESQLIVPLQPIIFRKPNPLIEQARLARIKRISEEEKHIIQTFNIMESFPSFKLYRELTEQQRIFEDYVIKLYNVGADEFSFQSKQKEIVKPNEEYFKYINERMNVKKLSFLYQKKYGFAYLKENLYLSLREKPFNLDEGCGCSTECDENCLNYVMKIECVNCKLGKNCKNKNFQEKKWVDTEIRSAGEKGNGLFTNEHIKRGQFVIEYVGEVLSFEQLMERKKKRTRHCYFFNIGNDLTIDASLKGCEARFMNHSCDSNLEPQKWSVNGETRIGFFSVKDIPKDTELTFDYSFENFTEMCQKCYCGAENCRGIITPKQKATSSKTEDIFKKIGKEKRSYYIREEKKAKVLLNFLEDPMLHLKFRKAFNFKRTFILNRNIRRGVFKRKLQIIEARNKFESELKKKQKETNGIFKSDREKRKHERELMKVKKEKKKKRKRTDKDKRKKKKRKLK